VTNEGREGETIEGNESGNELGQRKHHSIQNDMTENNNMGDDEG